MTATYTKSTNAKHKISLKGKLVSALWLSGAGRAGGTAGFKVTTSLVGDGAAVEITGKSENGTRLGKASGKIRRNEYAGEIDIPDKVEPGDAIYFEAKLPKHGLKEESNRIPVKPRPSVRSMAWDRSAVHRGDEVTLTCEFDGGVADGDGAVVLVRQHDPNAVDRPFASLPAVISGGTIEISWRFDYPPSTDGIPTEAALSKAGKHYIAPQYYFVVVLDGIRIGANRESGLLAFRDTAEFSFTDEYGAPYADYTVNLAFADGSTQSVTLDKDGRCLADDVPPGPCGLEFLDRDDSSSRGIQLKARTGAAQKFVIPCCGIIDAHMHIMSGNCSPLPVAWAQMPDAAVPFLKALPRSAINALPDTPPAKLVDRAVVHDQIKKISDLAARIGGLLRKTVGAVNADVNGLAVLLVNIAQNLVQSQLKAAPHDGRDGPSTTYDVFRLIKETLSSGAGIASDIDGAVREVCQKIETARSRDSEAYRLTSPQITAALATLELAADVAEGIVHAVADACGGAAKAAQIVSKAAGGCLDKLKKLVAPIANVAESFVERAVRAAFNAGSQFFLNLVKSTTQDIASVVGAAATVCETASKFAAAFDGGAALLRFIKIQRMQTDGIGSLACANNPSRGAAFAPLICQLMDMEYAHLDGYKGSPVYRKATKRYFVPSSFVTSEGIEVQYNADLPPDYEPGRDALTNVKSERLESFRYYRYDRDAAGVRGPAVWMYQEESRLFETYPKQMAYSAAAAMRNPWKLFPMYHYDPRRWITSWKFPFSRLLQTKSSDPEPAYSHRAFVGFKMYPALGYHPLDGHLPRLKDFYAECAGKSIPILAHCSPGGYHTHEWENYLGYYRAASPSKTPESKSYELYKSAIGGVTPQAQFFVENIAAPSCWKRVLDLPGCGELKLCLAHFAGGGSTPHDILYAGWHPGATLKNADRKQSDARAYNWRETVVDMITCGKYPNLYTDIAYFPIADHYDLFLSTIDEVFGASREKGIHLLNRIMLGTDWYVTEIDGKNYRSFYEANMEHIDRLDRALRKKGHLKQGGPTLWQWFAMINPFEFYDFHGLRDEIKKVMLSWGRRETDSKLTNGYAMTARMKRKIDALKKSA
jgi:hypothetical protein